MKPPAFSLEVLRALHGDCLILHHGDNLVLIDGGPATVYEEALRPRLEELMAATTPPLFFDIVMVSHIDDDHIVGLGDMFNEAVARKEDKKTAEWRAGDLWLNAFGALTGASPKDGDGDAKGAAADALVAAAPGAESQAIAASIKNGIALHEDSITLAIPRNASFKGALVERAGGAGATVDVVPGLTFTVIAPDRPRLDSLRTKWEQWEKDHPVKEAANVDRSVFNLSSIVVLARSGDRTLLLTGDARSDDILDGLEAAGLFADGDPLTVDVLKLPHHGSSRNVKAEFFERVHARNYVASGDGSNGNPEDETLKMLCDSRLNDTEPWTLWLTYGAVAGDGKPGLHERLDKFFKARAAKQKLDVRIAKPGERHTIDLA